MVIDTSAVITIVKQEPGYERYFEAIASAPVKSMSALSLFETRAVLYGYSRKSVVVELADKMLMQDFRVEIVPYDLAVADLAYRLFVQYGKGINPVALNMADCAVAALALLRNDEVLSTSDEFARAGIRSVAI